MSKNTPFGLRMKPDLRERVLAAAKENNRSMNSEIIFNLTRIYSVKEATESEKAGSPLTA